MDWAMVGVILGVNTTVVLAATSWVIFLVRDLRADIRELRAEVRQQGQDLRAEMRQQHQDLLVILQGHTHDEEGVAVFHELTASSD